MLVISETDFNTLYAIVKYYADESNYKDAEYGYNLVAPIEFDKGAKARKLLDTLLKRENSKYIGFDAKI